MSEITKLEPKLVWELFDAITRVPRPSKKEEKIREFLVDFAKKHNIDYQTDQTGNVVMRVPGTKGYENRPCVILQSHRTRRSTSTRIPSARRSSMAG